jgi:RNase P/RNase MRP subunit p29
MVRLTTLAQCFIGKEMVVVGSTNGVLVGLVGEIVNETEQTFVVNAFDGQITLLKSSIAFTLDDDPQVIYGTLVQKRVATRIKQ